MTWFEQWLGSDYIYTDWTDFPHPRYKTENNNGKLQV